MGDFQRILWKDFKSGHQTDLHWNINFRIYSWSKWPVEKQERIPERQSRRPSPDLQEPDFSSPLGGNLNNIYLDDIMDIQHIDISTQANKNSIAQDPPSPEESQFRHRSCRSHGRRLQLGHPGVPHCRGPRVGRKCLQGSQGQENHSQTLAGTSRFCKASYLYVCWITFTW